MAQATQQLQDLKKIQEQERQTKDLLKPNINLLSPPYSKESPIPSTSPLTIRHNELFIQQKIVPPVISIHSPELKKEACDEIMMREVSPEPTATSLSPTEQSRLDFHPEENIELEDLEEFAKDFKQRRIKLGYTQVLFIFGKAELCDYCNCNN